MQSRVLWDIVEVESYAGFHLHFVYVQVALLAYEYIVAFFLTAEHSRI